LLTDKNISNYILREPGGTKVSERIRRILLDKNNIINKEEETLLFLSSRANLVNEIIIPKLKNKDVVLCDRYIDSTIAYQAFGRGMNLNLINKMNEFATNKCIPILTIIFDIDPNIVQDRLTDKVLDRMEVAGIEFQKRVREGYLEIATMDKRYSIIQCNNKKIEEIHIEVIDIVNLHIEGLKR